MALVGGDTDARCPQEVLGTGSMAVSIVAKNGALLASSRKPSVIVDQALGTQAGAVALQLDGVIGALPGGSLEANALAADRRAGDGGRVSEHGDSAELRVRIVLVMQQVGVLAFCGTGSDYYGTGCQAGPCDVSTTNDVSVASIVTPEFFAALVA
ncbi:hypothetical protein OsJ_35682 [Oryza sativa Japonica Group]|uniref:Uncharacterized protein n=2 Tax=Oryza sativa subsp. japonica TaxID=39947 RepID=A0A8J8YSZ4_ORYSJ|nr:expressed protein [Oryza sativa Japonica Group]EAZ20083.1 hypothetical protein OsJ_35682 [Oryza sativa Japonica Group]